MKIGIIGASGFVGTRLTEYLHLTGKYEVCPIVRRFGGLATIARFDLPWKIGRVENEAELTQALEGCDFAVHSINGDDEVISRSAQATYRAAEAAGVRRLVFISSAVVYGPAPSLDTDETAMIEENKLDSYGRGKLALERDFLRLRESGKVEVSILRPSLITGPRSFWTRSPAEQLLGGTAYLVEGGAGYFNSVYVDNLIEAILLAAEQKEADGQIFQIGDGDIGSWRSYYEHLASLLGLSSLVLPSVPPASPERRSWPARIRAHQVTGRLSPFVPKVVKGGLRGAYQALKANRPLPAPSAAGPRASSPFSELHRTRWRLSSKKAEDLLGYRPAISFQEGLKRSVEWLRFAGLAEQPRPY